MRRRARLAYEREMEARLADLRNRFRAWEHGERNSAELLSDIESFHEGVMRERQVFMEDPNPENVLGWATAHNVVSGEKLTEDIAHTIGRAVKACMTTGHTG
jgi:hypothetical protein